MRKTSPATILWCAAAFALPLAGASTLRAAERLRPVGETARPCPGYGPGFVQIPGSGSCVRISGRVSSAYTTTSRRISRDDISGFSTGARVSADVRTDTDYGPMRTYVRMKAGTGAPIRN